MTILVKGGEQLQWVTSQKVYDIYKSVPQKDSTNKKVTHDSKRNDKSSFIFLEFLILD